MTSYMRSFLLQYPGVSKDSYEIKCIKSNLADRFIAPKNEAAEAPEVLTVSLNVALMRQWRFKRVYFLSHTSDSGS